MIESGASESGLRRFWAWAAWGWLLVVLVLGVQQFNFWRAPAIDSDVMALLPVEQRDLLLKLAEDRIAGDATRQVVVLLGTPDWGRSRAAATAFQRSLEGSAELRQRNGNAGAAALDFYRPYRDRLLTTEQRRRLEQSDIEGMTQQSIARLFGPAGGLTEWRSDPLDLWLPWWQSRLGADIGERDGLISLSRDGTEWILLHYEAASAFRLDGVPRLQLAFDDATRAARAVAPDVRILHAGVPLHAEAAATRASWEMNTIGLGSLLAVIALMWLAFRSPLPTLLVAMSLVIGTAAGVAVTVWLFGSIHLLTLVFGASLVGVAEDYGIHYFACRQGQEQRTTFGLMRYLMPGLFLAWVTSALAYLALGAAPLPGLRQMAVFSTAGLAAAFATVACWFPWLDRGPRPISRFGRFIGNSLARWPRLGGRASLAVTLLVATLSLALLPRLSFRDDLRSLQSSPEHLIAQQKQVSKLLGLASPAQFFLVRGVSAQQVLEREEILKAGLDRLIAQRQLGGYEAVSDWAPSSARQHADAALTGRVESGVLERVGAMIGERIERPTYAPSDLRVEDWLAQPASAPFRSRWLGQTAHGFASVVMLKGLDARSDLSLLAREAGRVPGVRWVDRTADISAHLAHYRRQMGLLWLGGLGAVAIVLFVRYRRHAWRAVLPTVLASLLTLVGLAALGESFQLFTVLALLLLLGMGVDYGIFLIEHQDDGASWLAVSLGASSTLLAFGLLALSATPALHSFGLTLLLGIALVWALSPLFRPPMTAVVVPPSIHVKESH
ncbi:MMPL family transporter [Arenimonas sp.]|uniref:MMPL family transporter n=1 Tax=Arenimonas sp. TaxID=1872635 RepID=UPI0039E6ECFE